FGLLGHAYEMMDASGTTAEFALSRIPLLSQVRRLVAEGVAPGGSRANMRHLSEHTGAGPGVGEEDLLLLYDAPASCRLRVALPAEQADAFAARCRERGAARAAVVGAVKPRGAKRLEVVKGWGNREGLGMAEGGGGDWGEIAARGGDEGGGVIAGRGAAGGS